MSLLLAPSLTRTTKLTTYEGLTNEQIEEILRGAGTLINFRLVLDRDTQKPKGFGFAEFSDADSAATAVRNLDGHDINGRKLRVDYTNEGGSNDNAPAAISPSQTHSMPNGQDSNPTSSSSAPLPLPPGQELPPGVTCADAISSTLSAVPIPQLLDMLSSMKGVVTTEPGKASELLARAPQLSYAIFQSLLLLGLVDTSVLSAVVGQAQAPQAQQPAPPPQSAPAIPQPGPSPFYAQQPYQHMQPPNTMTPPAPHQYQQPPPPSQLQPGNQAELIQRLLVMPQHEIDALDPDSRAKILAIRQNFMNAGRI